MEKLTIQEEQVMQAVWKTGEGIVKDFISKLSNADSVPYTTVASVVRNLERKGYVKSRKIANVNLYTPAIEIEDYKKHFLKDVVKDYFTDSYKDLVLFFVEDQKISSDGLREILDLIENK